MVRIDIKHILLHIMHDFLRLYKVHTALTILISNMIIVDYVSLVISGCLLLRMNGLIISLSDTLVNRISARSEKTRFT
jgi:hypothetical protein